MKFAPWARAILEGWAAGDYDGLGQVVFSRADDSTQRLYYYLCELQRRGLVGGPEALILDIAKVPRAEQRGSHGVQSAPTGGGLASSEISARCGYRGCNLKRARADAGPRQARPCLWAGTPPPDGRLPRLRPDAGFARAGPNAGRSLGAHSARSVDARTARMRSKLSPGKSMLIPRGPALCPPMVRRCWRPDCRQVAPKRSCCGKSKEGKSQAWRYPLSPTHNARRKIGPALIVADGDWAGSRRRR